MKSADEYLYNHVQTDAKRFSREFFLDLNTFRELIHSPCYYCGATDTNCKTFRGGPRKDGTRKAIYKDVKYNGIDRKDNDLGYIEGNCVSCCIICNRAKRDMGYEQFVDWINRLVDNRNKKTTEFYLYDNVWISADNFQLTNRDD